ncbi:hypothetical protein EJ02DRAFT_509781 [Clathrospora elynae]|uniref:Uncharacterized protein n=1 Tax=Clathrospora elynae TaxID=706981 RepID=A0A6A5SZD6_9PLEO|nr:hypothetical protein EJ02DRAFT_509781 [Clathrospora elynae]
MSGPFRFNQEEARSPLDRTASPFSAGQPVSFKTNVNRAKTKKWVQAKKNAYDGDDWGEYDEYDEYGVNPESQQPEPQAAHRYYAQRTEQPSRSFTDPSQQAPLSKARRNSFEHGEEQRAFSSSIPHPQQGYGQQQHYGEPQRGYGQQHEEPQRQASGAESDQGHDPQDRRNYSPSAMPPPLQTRISQVPADFTPLLNTQFPPRKSSIGQGESPMTTSPRPRTGSQSDKPLPFIRPAEIYKRHQEEQQQQRASLDSSRPSLDSLSSRPQDEVTEAGKSLQPMETVAERKSEYLPDFDAAARQNSKQPLQTNIAEFNTSSCPSGPQSQAPGSHAPVVSRPSDQGFRSVVDQAFTRTDDQRSVPPTPISNDSNSDLLRSNTDSTSGISPIMSRVPSLATSALRNRNQTGGEGSTPAIIEEPSETTTQFSQPTLTKISEPLHRVPRKPSPAHSRNISNSSTPHSGLATPTRGDSPARSPALAPQRNMPEPKSALFTTDTNDSTEAMEGGLEGTSSAYATREADLATAMKSGPAGAAPELSEAERQSQDAFLESHHAQSPIEDAFPRDRSESPSKGRVQALAGKFGEVSQPRRGSTQSNLSRNSVQSWERSHDNSRAASPTKGSPSKPSSPVKEFRPHLPGQWESYATTAITPSEQDKRLSTTNNNSTPLDKVDLTPKPAKQLVTEGLSPDTDPPDPIAALKNAGAAIVQSFRTTVGLDDGSSEPQQTPRGRVNHGDINLPRPLQLDRTVSAISSAPPTPPAKDTPQSEFPPPPPLKERASQPFKPQPKRPSLDPQLSTDPSAEDHESDRLRKEIVASLGPIGTSASPNTVYNPTSLQPVSPNENRASSILPSEYDTYWADQDVSSRSSQDTGRNVPAPSSAAPSSFPTQTDEPQKPAIMNRFSWEASNPQLQPSDGHAQALVNRQPKTSQEDTTSSPTIELAAEEKRQQWSEGLTDSYFGPGHTFTITKPESIADSNLEERPSTPPLDPRRSLVSSTREHTRSPGLHVVNTETDPEAVDLPPRFSAEHQQAPAPSQEDIMTKQRQEDSAAPPPVPVAPSELPKTPTTQEFAPKSPATDKPLGAREIATINSTSERIATYNRTRDQWATADHGLGDWLASSLQANPELVTQTFSAQIPHTGSARHRHTGSLARFGKLGGSSTHDQSPDLHSSAGGQVPASATSPTTATPSGSGFGGRIANQQMQLKGKDLLHTANILSGKGVSSAKGLLAKGKSRFGRDKAFSQTRTDSAPSSRQTSEEPEIMTRRSRVSAGFNATSEKHTPEKHLTRASTEKQRPFEEKKKRRFSFSSQFRRASRSRSRPSSIALPSNAPSVFSNTPKNTLPRELHHYLMGERRPNSFHAPDSWTEVPPTALTDYFSTTPPRRDASQSRLGILPSPAKSVFSSQDKNVEQDVPPVPPIPDEVAVEHYRRRSSQDSTSHRMLQSVIRHSTPPVMASRHALTPVMTREVKRLHESPFLDSDTEAGADETNYYRRVSLGAADGSPTVDLTNAEPEKLRHNEFQFGFASQAPRQNDHDDDDQPPPQLNHDPLPKGTQSYQTSPFIPSAAMDMSDDDDDDEKPLPVNDISSLLAQHAERKVGDVIPLLLPVHSSLVGVPVNDDDGLQTAKQNERSHQAEVVSIGDTSFVLIRRETDDMTTTRQLNENALSGPQAQTFGRSSAIRLLSDVNSDGSGHISDFLYERANEYDIANGHDAHSGCSLTVDDLTQGQFVSTNRVEETQKRPAFETVLMGPGDISLVSTELHNAEDEDATPKVEKSDLGRAFSPVGYAKNDLRLSQVGRQGTQSLREGSKANADTFSTDKNASNLHDPSSKAIGEIAFTSQSEATRDASLNPDWPPRGANADMDNQTRRVSASPFQVVHAVEGYAASNSSLASWNHDIVAAESHADASEPDEMKDEGDLVTPVAQVPRITENGPQADKAGELDDDNSHHAVRNGYFRGYANLSDPRYQSQQLQASRSDMTVPERSRSILSQISAMVSEEGTPISPASSNAGRSTPSTIRRMHLDSSARTALNSAQIPEEATTTWDDRTPTDKDGDFDLYADHNGIVKDVMDESGQPLRVADVQPDPAQHSQAISSTASNIGTAPGLRDEERPRYSTERPMSFISGPADQDGKPQDQINQFAPLNDMQILAIPEQHRQQTHPLPAGTVGYSNPPTHLAQPRNQVEARHRSLPAPAPSPPKNISQAVESISSGTIATNAPGTSSASQPIELTPLSKPAERPITNGQVQDSPIPGHGLGDPHTYRTSGQSIPRGPPVQSQMVVPDHDTQAQGQGPSNQYEFHQQLMQLQAKYPRLQGVEHQAPNDSSQLLDQQAPALQKEQPSKPRLSSVFKAFGGKSQPTSQQQPRTDPASTVMRSNLNSLPAYPNANHSPSSHSVVSSAHSRKTSAGRPSDQIDSFVHPNRPPHFSQVGQDYTRPHPTDPRIDLKKPIISAPTYGIPPQQPSPIPSGQSQPSRASASGVPESGKKKRFSSLGALFGRSGPAADGLATKSKLSKEEKKAQKAHRMSATAPAKPLAFQWPPQQQEFKSKQPSLAYDPPGQLPPHTAQAVPPMGLEYKSPQTILPTQPQGAQGMHLQRLSLPYQQLQQGLPTQQPLSDIRSEPGSAFLRTKQLAEEPQPRQNSLQSPHSVASTIHAGTQSSSASFDYVSSHLRQTAWDPLLGGYYEPDTKHPMANQGAYVGSLAAPQQVEQDRQQGLLREQGAYGTSQAGRFQAQPRRQQSGIEAGLHRDHQFERQQAEQQRSQLPSQQLAYQAMLAQRQQIQREQEQLGHGRGEASSNEGMQAQQQRQQQQQQQHPNNAQPLLNHRSVLGPSPNHASQEIAPFPQRHVSSPMAEPTYEAPPIPAAYGHVSGAFVSPLDRPHQPLFPPQHDSAARPSPSQFGRQYSDPHMPSISPQISAQSQAPPNNRTHSDASTVSVVSPISNSPDIPASSPPPGGQRFQRPRMSSISEVHQQERQWHLNFPEGATEQEIVRARQRQYMQEHFTAQQQLQVERATRSPSPRTSADVQTSTEQSGSLPQDQMQGGGFKELLPRNSPQPYLMSQPAQSSREELPLVPVNLDPVQPTSIHTGQILQPAAYPLPTSPDSASIASSANPMADALPPPPPPKIPHSPMWPAFSNTQPLAVGRPNANDVQRLDVPPPHGHEYVLQPGNEPQYEESESDEPPPSYDGPGVPNNGLDKSRPEAPRPPNITTNANADFHCRQRQLSIGILQQPQPASMAASPQRSSADMGAESLRRQLLQQEDLVRMERIQRTQEQRAVSERERKDRAAARARAQDLERSASGGGQVGSLRSVGGSHNGGAPGWEIRGSSSRPVFELPAVEDEEPTMKATSYPGQEWVPPMWDGD